VQNAPIPCCSQELLPLLFVIYFFLPSFVTHYSFLSPHFILSSISWSTSQSCLQIHTQYSSGNYIFFHSLYMTQKKQPNCLCYSECLRNCNNLFIG
jgi:hypothetical protein